MRESRESKVSRIQNKELRKNEKGSIVLFVIIAMMFFLVIVFGIYINVKNKLNLTEVYCNGNSIYVYCPFCGKEDRKTANLRLNVDLDSYYCNCCGESGYAVGLYAKCNYISTKTAFKRLMSQDSNMQTSLQYIKKA